MRQFYSFVVKEFYHIFRDRKTLIILLGMPMVQIIIFGFALSNEVKNAHIGIVNQSNGVNSVKLTQKIEASRYFELYNYSQTNQLHDLFKSGKIKIGLIIPADFDEHFLSQNAAPVQIIADASDPNVASTLTSYLSVIINDFQQSISSAKLPYPINIETRMMYNPQQVGAYNFVPGVMAMVLLLIGTMMTALTVVKEKELGNMEVLLVSPLNPILVIFSKAIPYLLLSIVNIFTILLLSYFVLEVPINGSLLLLILVSILFMMVSLGLGLLISSATASQQSAMFISLIGMFLPTVMLSGFIFPIENMPFPMRMVSNLVPAKWYFIIVKGIMIKGVGFEIIRKELMVLLIMAIVFFSLAVKNFKIRLT